MVTDDSQGPELDTARSRMEAMIAAMRRPARSGPGASDDQEDERLAAIVRQAMNLPPHSGDDGDERDREPSIGTLDPSRLASRETEPATGSGLSRYLPIEELGRGAMGRVLRAYDPKLQREVALKVLSAGVADVLGRARMVREARTMARLTHPHVVAVYDVEDDPRYGVVLAMELVRGTTLHHWLHERTRRMHQILEAFIEAGRGLAAAHAEGLLHRDFKPANVLVAHGEREGSRGPVKVTDFGLAKLDREPSTLQTASSPAEVSGHTGASESLTEAGVVMGTPAYMAPEQHRGDSLTPAADQFSFCVALWEALYEQRPFAGKSPIELTLNVLEGKVREPAKGRAVPSWLRRTCERGLSVDPQQRWPSMDALLERLSRGRTRARVRKGLAVLGGLAMLGAGAAGWQRYDLAQRTEACEESGDEVHTAWNAQRQLELHDALVATGVSYAQTTADKVMPWLDRQPAAWHEARVGACMDANVHERWDAVTYDRSLWCLDERHTELQSLVDELTRADEDALPKAVTAAAGLTSVVSCRDPQVLQGLKPPLQEDREAIRQVRADVIRAGNLDRAGRYPAGLELAREALARAEDLQWPPLSTRARLSVGILLWRTGAYDEAERVLEDAYFEAAEGAMSQLALSAATELVYVVGECLARRTDGQRWGRLAEVVLAHLPGEQDLYRAKLFNNIGGIYHAVSAYDQAEQYFAESALLYERVLGSNHPYQAVPLANLTGVYYGTGASDRAIMVGERALSIRERAYGPEHPEVATNLSNLGLIYQQTGAHERAKSAHERALAIREKALGPEHPDFAASLTNLGLVEADTGAYDEARDLHERALRTFEETMGPEHPYVAIALTNLGQLHGLRGAYEESRPLVERALAIFEKALGPDHPHLAAPLMSLAEIALEQHRPADAIPLAERAVALRTKGALPHEVAAARFSLARALWDADENGGRDRVRARRLAEQARDAFRGAGKVAADHLREVDAWLGEHGDERASNHGTAAAPDDG